MTDADVAVKVAWSYIGTPYRWGGDDPEGFDCSGLVIECLKSCGALPRRFDTTADGLRRRFTEIGREDLVPGDLIFWMNRAGDRAVHVGIAITERLYIGAEGGGRSTTSVEAAMQRNAFIKVRSIDSRGREVDRRYGRWSVTL